MLRRRIILHVQSWVPLVNTLERIRDNKQHTIDEGKKVNESLKAYQEKYARQMQELHDELTVKFNDEEMIVTCQSQSKVTIIF